MFYPCFAGLPTRLAAVVLLSITAAGAADLWVGASNAAVGTNNDCGVITAAQGGAAIRRSFQAEGEAGAPAHVADRVNSGDELVCPSGGRIEMVSGGNIVLTVGDNSRARLNGLRIFTDSRGIGAARLDLGVVSGEIRMQVRVNENKTNCALISLNGVDVLVRRGDIVLSSRDGWLASSIAGGAMGRVRRGSAVGAPFDIGERQSVGGAGSAPLTDSQADALRARLPFSFELARAALPPAPAGSDQLEAP